MAVYRGMDIGTAKPTAAQRAAVPHHLIDIVDPVDKFSVSRYRELALQQIDAICARGRDVVFAGGTALYLKAMLRGIFEGPPANPEFRESIERELGQASIEQLHARLEQVDPVTASRVHVNDKRRIIRALEVYATTGTPISHLQYEFETAHSPDECKVFTLRHPREVLHGRIARRVESMFDAGLVEEVAGLLERWGELGRTARQAVGYQEVIAHLRQGVSLGETMERTLFRTRQFARHQETWFRNLPECRMLDLADSFECDASAPRRVAEQMISLAERASQAPGGRTGS
jgi:tRNA dimethylallyltransferase